MYIILFLQSSSELLEHLQLAHSHIGILLDPRSDRSSVVSPELLRQRVRALPALHRHGCFTFNSIFPKGCLGCIGLNLVCAAEVLNDSKLIHDVIKTILGDPAGRLYPIDKIRSFQGLSRRYYQRRSNDRYPFMGNCLDFGLFNGESGDNADFIREMNTLGERLSKGEGSSKDQS